MSNINTVARVRCNEFKGTEATPYCKQLCIHINKQIRKKYQKDENIDRPTDT